jgi:hypothetical protein
MFAWNGQGSEDTPTPPGGFVDNINQHIFAGETSSNEEKLENSPIRGGNDGGDGGEAGGGVFSTEVRRESAEDGAVVEQWQQP